MSRKEELLTVASQARDELSTIERAERIEHNKKVVGKCFRYCNSYSGPSASWWLYVKVISINDLGLLHALKFQCDSNGDWRIEPHAYMEFPFGRYEPIDPSDFNREWESALKAIGRMNP